MKFSILAILVAMCSLTQAQNVRGVLLQRTVVSAYDERVPIGLCGMEWPVKGQLFCGWRGGDSRGLAPAGIDVVDVHTGKRIRRFSRPSDELKMMRVSRDGSRVAGLFATGDRYAWQDQIFVWDVHSTKQLALWKMPKIRVQDFAFSPDGRYIAAGGGDGTIHLWNVGQKTEKWKLRAGGSNNGGYMVGFAFSRDSARLYSWKMGVDDPNAQGWLSASSTGKTRLIGRKIPCDTDVRFALSPQERAFFVGPSRVGSTIFDVSTFMTLSQNKTIWSAHSLRTTKAQFSSDGHFIALDMALDNENSGQGEVRVAQTGRIVARITSNCERGYYPVVATAFSPDSKTLAVISTTGPANWYAIRLYALPLRH